MAVVIRPTSCTIDSTLDALADGLTLQIVEEDSAAPLAPTAVAWRTLSKGDLIQIQLGLEGLGEDDYGVFRIDRTRLTRRGGALETTITARDLAALLIDEKAAATFDPTRPTTPEEPEGTYRLASWWARQIAARTGATVLWQAADFPLHGFRVDPGKPASAALLDLVEPLRQSRYRYADVWAQTSMVDGLPHPIIVVRQRGTGAIAGTIDCRLGTVDEIAPDPAPRLGPITVDGAQYRTSQAITEPTVDTPGTPTSPSDSLTSVEVTEPDPDTRIVEHAATINGEAKVVSRETETMTYEDVYGDGTPAGDQGGWLGRVLVRSTAMEESNLHLPEPTQRRRVVEFGYDEQWRQRMREERVWTFTAGDGWLLTQHTVVHWQQISPTDVRVETWDYQIDNSNPAAPTEKLKRDYPKWEQQPGTLGSAIQGAGATDRRWEEAGENGAPASGVLEKQAAWQYTSDDCAYQNGRLWYKTPAYSGGGEIRAQYSRESLYGYDICRTIASYMEAGSGRTFTRIQLTWPRPFPYRKGAVVMLTYLPGGQPDTAATIIGIATRFSWKEASWVHTITFEAVP